MARRSQRPESTPSLFSDTPEDVEVQIPLPASWASVLGQEWNEPYFAKLQSFVAEERQSHTVFPAEEEVYAAFQATPFDQVRVVILGQDPYPTPGHAHGLAFSVRPGVALPGSLRNIFQELHSDLGIPPVRNGSLIPWAERGVLLLNSVLTVRAGEPGSHARKGWERFTDTALKALNERNQYTVFLLWGNYARKKALLIDPSRHGKIESAHPSPLSAHNGFFGSKPFSQVNALLEAHGQEPIDWRLPG